MSGAVAGTFVRIATGETFTAWEEAGWVSQHVTRRGHLNRSQTAESLVGYGDRGGGTVARYDPDREALANALRAELTRLAEEYMQTALHLRTLYDATHQHQEEA